MDDGIWHTHEDPSFSCWNMHGTYLCMLGTNLCAADFLRRALLLNPDLGFIDDLIPIYERLHRQGFTDPINMEGGFGLPPKVIKDRQRMRPISERIMELTACCGEILGVFERLV